MHRIILVIALFAIVNSCSQTAGEEIRFSTAVVGSSADNNPAEFTTYAGWKVSLTRALMVAGPIYYYEGEAQASWIKRLFTTNKAYACPSHAQYNKGSVLGEVLEQYVVDLLNAQPTHTGDVYGLSGTVRAAELQLHPPATIPVASASADIHQLEGDTILVEGKAEKDGASISYIAHLTIPDEGIMRVVESISGEVELAKSQNGTLLLMVLLDQWFANVDFSTLHQQDENDRFLFSEDTQAYSALLRNVRSRYAYRINWSE